MNVKIHDVAERAGVSISSVSRVVNGYQHVSQSVRDKVEKAIAELEYHPNRAARSLASSRSNLIGILVPDLTNHYYAKMISALEEKANEREYSIIVCNLKEDLKKEKRYIGMFNELQVDGVILMHEKIDAETKNLLVELDVPVVLASVKIPDMEMPSVNIDDYGAAYDATKYLTGLGHEKIAMITGDMTDPTAGIGRFDGYKQALEDSGISYVDQLVKEGDFQLVGAYNLMKEFLMLKDRPTAIFAASDVMAIGAMNCAMDMGFRVPEDISFIGFDNIDMAEVVRPRLTTVEQPAEAIGREALKKLFSMIDKAPYETETILPYKIIEGASCTQRK